MLGKVFSKDSEPFSIDIRLNRGEVFIGDRLKVYEKDSSLYEVFRVAGITHLITDKILMSVADLEPYSPMPKEQLERFGFEPCSVFY